MTHEADSGTTCADRIISDSGNSDDEKKISNECQRLSTDTSFLSLSQSGTEHLSKKQQRKLKKQEKWLQIKAQKRAQEKEKKKQKKREAIAKGETLGPSRKRLKDNTMEKSACKVKVVIDCFFDKYMSEKDIMKLTKQVQFCYSSNRRADNPLQYYVTGVHGQMKERLQRIGDYLNWDVHFSEENYFDIFRKEDIVYLSSDSPHVLTDLEDGKAYIIGGLVDHNHHKGLCHQLAEERGVAHAQLPLTEYLDMKTRKVLTINHVFDILLRYTETKDWQKAFFSVLPQRKGAKVKSEGEIKMLASGVPVDASHDDKEDDDDSSDSDSFSDQQDAHCKTLGTENESVVTQSGRDDNEVICRTKHTTCQQEDIESEVSTGSIEKQKTPD